MSRTPFSYRRDLDGLRAVAVLLVLSFHAFPARFPGGYLGVDVFFVISGFVITSLSIAEEGEFGILGFYGRRVRRLFPALALVLLALLFAGRLALFPLELVEAGRSVVASALFKANYFHQASSLGSYFDPPRWKRPLLHLWSLGVEGQFYLAWPVLFLLARKLRIGLIFPLLALSAWSLACAVRGGGLGGDEFFLPQCRAWEIGLGCMLGSSSWREQDADSSWSSRALAEAAMIAGFALLTAAVAVVAVVAENTEARPLPAILPAVAGAGFIVAAGRKSWLGRSVLGHSWLVGVGKLSYPLYLWHWPLLFFLRVYENATPAPLDIWLTLAAGFALAWLTVQIVELPARRGGRMSVLASVAGLGAAGALGQLVADGKIAPSARIVGLGPIVEPRSLGGVQPGVFETSRLGTYYHGGQSGAAALLIGDSNALQYLPRVEKLLRIWPGEFRSVTIATRPGCIPVGVEAFDSDTNCVEFVREALDYVDDPHFGVVIIVAHWAGFLNFYYGGNAQSSDPSDPALPVRKVSESFVRLLDRLHAKGVRTYIVLSIPNSIEFDVSRMVQRHFWLPWEINLKGIPLASWRQSSGRYEDQLRALAERGHAEVIDPIPDLCRGGFCPAVDAGGRPIYADNVHLNADFVRDQVRYLDQALHLPGARAQTAGP